VETRFSSTYREFVKKVTFTGDIATVTFENLDHHTIYLVKVNMSDLVVSAANTGRPLVLYSSPESFEAQHLSDFIECTEIPLPPIGDPDARNFSANPPLIERTALPKVLSAFVPPSVGDRRNFWVERPWGSGQWVHSQATLRAAGNHGNIWVMDDNRRTITTAQAQALVNRFDLIYPLTTNILGFEYRGESNGLWLTDGDSKIQILVYDILDASENVAVAGFFWAKDLYTQNDINRFNWTRNPRTNQANIFYLDASLVLNIPDYIYSVLTHELQHMINFNQKTIRPWLGTPRVNQSSEAWYNEMLSMMAEDIISPLIDITSTNQGHPISQKIPTFLGSYNRVGFTEWDTSDILSESYAAVFSFGAYLLRNFGGAALLQSIMANNTANIESVTAALQEISGVTFEEALSRFGEAMIFSGDLMPGGVLTFDRTIRNTLNGVTYTAHSFNIWDIQRHSSTQMGPLIFDLSPRNMRPHSVIVQSSSVWQNRSGSFSITLERPSNQSIELYLMAR
jgi:hypothetical protein